MQTSDGKRPKISKISLAQKIIFGPKIFHLTSHISHMIIWLISTKNFPKFNKINASNVIYEMNKFKNLKFRSHMCEIFV